MTFCAYSLRLVSIYMYVRCKHLSDNYKYLPTNCFFSVVNENVSLVISRQLLTDVTSSLHHLGEEASKTVSHFLLEKVQPRVISFEEQVASIRQYLAGLYERENSWKEAANVLVGIPLETGQK